MEDIKKVLTLFDTIKAPYFCDYKTLKKCFRREIKKYHPDVSGDEEKAKTIIIAFKELEKIYQNRETLNHYRQIYETNNNNTRKNNISSHRESKDKTYKKKLIIVGFILLFVMILLLSNDFLIGILLVITTLTLIWGYRKV